MFDMPVFPVPYAATASPTACRSGMMLFASNPSASICFDVVTSVLKLNGVDMAKSDRFSISFSEAVAEPSIFVNERSASSPADVRLMAAAPDATASAPTAVPRAVIVFPTLSAVSCRLSSADIADEVSADTKNDDPIVADLIAEATWLPSILA